MISFGASLDSTRNIVRDRFKTLSNVQNDYQADLIKVSSGSKEFRKLRKKLGRELDHIPMEAFLSSQLNSKEKMGVLAFWEKSMLSLDNYEETIELTEFRGNSPRFVVKNMRFYYVLKKKLGLEQSVIIE